MTETQDQVVQVTADAVAGSWVYRAAPTRWRPWLKLARLDRPAGTWLLLWPCWWSVALASDGLPDPVLLALFALGSIVMRGAGCTYNDIVDRDFDAQVSRTASRPIPAGEVSVAGAWVFLIAQSLIGLGVLLTLQFQYAPLSVPLGLGALVLVAVYPFMKRITFWPQAWLGLTFNWGALMGYTAVAGAPDIIALTLYGGGVFWTLGYDTIYALQDSEDDALIGVKSSALRLGRSAARGVALFYLFFAASLFAISLLAPVGGIVYVSFVLAALHLSWQVRHLDIDDAERCLQLFRSNTGFGWILFIGLVCDTVVHF